jgi:hypothetical protein
MAPLRSLLLHVLLPLTVGGLIYLLFRAPGLHVFGWMGALGFGPFVAWSQAWASGLGLAPPAWVLYTLPDAVFAYSATACMAVIWRGAPGLARYAWMAAGAGLGLLVELAQLAGAFPGTFDPLDMLSCCVAAVVALALTHQPLESSP